MANKRILLLALIVTVTAISLSGAAEATSYNCWQFDDTSRTSCEGAFSGSACMWKTQAEDPWCTKSTGCCTMLGCWKMDNNQTGCESSSFMSGTCAWKAKINNQWCTAATGCCVIAGCWDFATSITCNAHAASMNCVWDGQHCFQDYANVGCASKTNQSACSAEGWCNWNGTACSEPSNDDWDEQFGGTKNCWSFDSSKAACGNVTGCIWCNATNVQNLSSFCYGEGVDICQGHEPPYNNQGVTSVDAATDPIECGDIKSKQICNCGPVTGCKWNSTEEYNYTAAKCVIGMASEGTCSAPPVAFCEGTTNQTICVQLATSYFMPCTWSNNKCAFESGFIFGNGAGTFGSITSEASCTMAGGNWFSEQYIDYAGSIKTDNWCEPSMGGGANTYMKESCDQSCWACEYQSNGAKWSTVSAAQAACTGSSLGYCQWTSNSFAPNGQGECKSPNNAKIFGGGSCTSSCYQCFTSTMCASSSAGCSWVNDPMGYGPGWCDPTSVAQMKNCTLNPIACSTSAQCTASTFNGSLMNGTYTGVAGAYWNTTYYICLPNYTNVQGGAQKEICFIPGDEDGDGVANCKDSDCSTDPSCGFGMDMGGFSSGSSGIGMGVGPGGSGPSMGGFFLDDPFVCVQHDGNEGLCLAQNGTGPMQNNTMCFYHPAPANTAPYNPVNNSQKQGQWWCDPIFDKMMGGNMIEAPPAPIGWDTYNDTLSRNAADDHLDIWLVGIHDMKDAIDIGIPVGNITNFAGCYKVYPGSNANYTGSYYRFIDIDNSVSTGCSAKGADGTNHTGFEYFYRYMANQTGGFVNDTFTPNYRCDTTTGTWIPHTSATAPSVITDGCYFADMFEGFTGVQVLNIKKSDIGNPTGTIRIFVSTANATTNESNPVDSAGPFYYTAGSIDFKFEDCFAPKDMDLDGDGYTVENDPDCEKINKFGFIPGESGPGCKDGLDNDGNGQTDCADGKCMYDPICGTYSFTSPNLNDKVAPTLVWQEIKTFPDGAMIMFDSDEPANGTLLFYKNDSKCATLNKTMYDMGIYDTYIEDYKPWHDVAMDNFAFNKNKLGYSLTNGTTYYYKTKLCDPTGNCATSACTNFTTAKTTSKSDCPKCSSTIKFGFNPPPGMPVTSPMGNMQFMFEWGDGTSSSQMNNAAYGVSANYTKGYGANMTLTNPNSTVKWGIKLENATITSFKSTTTNITSSDMVYNTTTVAGGTSVTYIGLNDSKWDALYQEARPALVELQIPGNWSELWQCENDLTGCVNRTANATAGPFFDTTNNYTIWKVPSTWGS